MQTGGAAKGATPACLGLRPDTIRSPRPACIPQDWRDAMSLTERNGERPVARRQQKEKRMPVLVARARQADGKAWLTIGAAWERKDGERGYSVKLNALPFNFDGTFVLLPPLSEEDLPPE